MSGDNSLIFNKVVVGFYGGGGTPAKDSDVIHYVNFIHWETL